VARKNKAEQSVENETETLIAGSEQDQEDRCADIKAETDSGLDECSAELSLEDQLAAAREEAEQYKDRFLRARADLENYRKRSIQHISEGVRDGQKQVFEAILPVVDNLERAVEYQEQHDTDSVEDLLTGVRMTLWQLREALERQEVKRIESLGVPFDPRFHEAVEVQEVEGDVESNTVVGEILAGYLLGDTVLRPARVRVAQ
jgi:molecular chaperone GrpE